MPPSMDSSTSSGSSEPITPPFNRNATWTASRSTGAAGAAATPDKEPSTPTGSTLTTPLSLRKRFASFTRSAGKSASGSLSVGATPPSVTPVDECSQRIEKLDLQKGAASNKTTQPPHAPSAPTSRRTSMTKEEPDVFSPPFATGKDDVYEDSPLKRILKSPNAQPLPGHPGNLTATQTQALHDLTQALKQDGALQDPESEPPSYQETQLLRFLRARSFNVPAARTMYLKAEAWKREIELDRLVQEFTFDERDAVAAHGWCMYFHKTDRLGRPIFIQDLGSMNCTEVFRKTTPERVIQNFAVTLELAVRHRYEPCCVASGRWVDDNMMVVNLAGLGLSTFWSMKGQLQQLLSILDNNFPELSGRVQIINAPYMFSTIWSWVKGWLPVATVEKIDIAGADYHERIWEYVRKEDWPKDLGGECECKGEKGCRKSDLGPWDRRLVRTADL